MLFATSAVVLALAALELSARGLVALSPAVAALAAHTNDYKLADPVLGLRGNPAFPDHDAAGWRNAARPEQAEVVAIGDSQTWGSETSRRDAWPQQAQAASGVNFYNMAIGGYGPVQYWRLVDEALALEPEQIVVTFYDGNDVYDVYRDIYLHDRGPEWVDASRVASLAALEENGPLHADWAATRRARKAPGKARLQDALDWLRGRLRVYALLQGVGAWLAGPPEPPASAVRNDFPAYRARAAGADPGLLVPFEDGRRSTIFTPRGRLQALRAEDPRVQEALRLTLALVTDMQRKCAAGQARLAFLLVPTKELVFAERVREKGARLHPSYAALIAAERALRARLGAHLTALGIPWSDALPELRASLAAGLSPYEMDWNGHPNPDGNAALARAALELTRSR